MVDMINILYGPYYLNMNPVGCPIISRKLKHTITYGGMSLFLLSAGGVKL